MVIDSPGMSDEDGQDRKSLLKAYLLCILGIIAPGVLVTDTLEPSESLRAVIVPEDVRIAVPNWYIRGFEELAPIHIIGNYDPNSGQILLTLVLVMWERERNYELLEKKLGKIAEMLEGRWLEL